jgi:hypothetical protein
LPPEVAGQVQNLEGQFQMIEQRKLDPNLTEEELQIFNERQNIIQQEIAQLIQAPQAPITPPAAQPIDLKSEQAYRMRITVEELEKDPAKVTARNVNPLAKELNLEIGATPQETLNTVKETLGMPLVAPVAEEVLFLQLKKLLLPRFQQKRQHQHRLKLTANAKPSRGLLLRLARLLSLKSQKQCLSVKKDMKTLRLNMPLTWSHVLFIRRLGLLVKM